MCYISSNDVHVAIGSQIVAKIILQRNIKDFGFKKKIVFWILSK